MKMKLYKIYEEALKAMNNGEFFFAAKKFSEAENILPLVEQSAKAKLMNGFCFYRINFYEESSQKSQKIYKNLSSK